MENNKLTNAQKIREFQNAIGSPGKFAKSRWSAPQ
jgi:hypothetical protein